MRDITHKNDTRRKALASALLTTEGEDMNALLEAARNDKGDALGIARIAGILAAKKTWEAIPMCHPIPVTHADVYFEVAPRQIRIDATCTTVAQTGCEIEAMHAAAVAAVALYDVLKPHTQDLAIRHITLDHKSGGKSDFTPRGDTLQAAIIVTSSAIRAGTRVDHAGDAVRAAIAAVAGLELVDYSVVDESEAAIRGALDAAKALGAHWIVTVGGTGLVATDITADVVAALITREVPGIMEAARAHGQRRTPYAMVSRGVAGLIENTLITTLPGSLGGATESFDAIRVGCMHICNGLRRSAADDAE